MSRSLVGSSSTSTLAGSANRRASSSAVALAARQRAHRRAGALGREQEVAEVAHHVLARAADLDPFAARADGVGQRGVEIQAVAQLVEVGHLQVAAAAHAAARRLELAQDELAAAWSCRRRWGRSGRSCRRAGTVAVKRSIRRAPSPKRIDTSSSSATILPLRQRRHRARAAPGRARSRRAARSARRRSSRATRPTLRVRRASTPLRTHTSSCASSLSARAAARASASSSRAFAAS